MTEGLRVTVSTGSRLHFGLLTHRPESGREFGGLGVMIGSPGWKLTVSRMADGSPATSDMINVSDEANTACPETLKRVAEIIERFRRVKHLTIPPLTVEVESAIPSHRGLGSGTQLALAAARAIDTCLEMGHVPVSELAQLTGRGLRSAVGIWGFESGGLIADGGKLESEPVGSLSAAVLFPSYWLFLLIFPKTSRGLSGDDEITAFKDLPGMTQQTTQRLCEISLMKLLPAVHDHNFDLVASALAAYGQLVGEYFAPAQGGVFADPNMLKFRDVLAEKGIKGFAQSSWGPTCAVLCSDDEMADRAVQLIRSLPEGADYECQVSCALNNGADIDIVEA